MGVGLRSLMGGSLEVRNGNAARYFLFGGGPMTSLVKCVCLLRSGYQYNVLRYTFFSS